MSLKINFLRRDPATLFLCLSFATIAAPSKRGPSLQLKPYYPFPSPLAPVSSDLPRRYYLQGRINYDYWPVWFNGENSIFGEEIIESKAA